MSVFADGVSVLSHPLAICSALELSVGVRELSIMTGSFRFVCFILIPVKALAMVLRDSLDHFVRLGLAEEHVSHKVCGGRLGLFGDSRATHETQLAGLESLDLLHGDKLVEVERVGHKLQEKTLFKRQLVMRVSTAVTLKQLFDLLIALPSLLFHLYLI